MCMAIIHNSTHKYFFAPTLCKLLGRLSPVLLGAAVTGAIVKEGAIATCVVVLVVNQIQEKILLSSGYSRSSRQRDLLT